MSLNRRDFLSTLGVGASTLPVLSAALAQELPGNSRELWGLVQLQLMLDSGLNWLDTASFGPSLRRVLLEEYRNREAMNRDYAAYERNYYQGDSLRKRLAELAAFLGADADEISFTSGATEALSTIAAGLEFAPDDEILTSTHEHPAAIYPWLMLAKRRNLRVVQLPLPSPAAHPQQIIDAFAAAITPRTRVMSFSHVQYTDGCVMPVRELCELAHAHNLLSIVDGAQAVGMLPLALGELGCDFYAGSLHKWLNGPSGSGFLYAHGAQRHRLWPLIVAGHDEWDGVDRYGLPDSAASTGLRASWPASLRKFGHNFEQFGPLFHSALAALAFQQEIGRTRVAARIRELAWYLRLALQRIEGVGLLTPAHPNLWAGIVSFHVPGIDLQRLAAELAASDRMFVRAVRHPGIGFEALRVSTHIFTQHDDLDRFTAQLARRLKS